MFALFVQESQFNAELDKGVVSRSLLLMPIKTRDGELVGVAVASNKLKQSGKAAQKRSVTTTQCSQSSLSENSAEGSDRLRKQSVVQDDAPSEQCIPFTAEDEQALERFVAVCALAVRNAALFEKSQLDNRRSEVLLELARCIFREQVELHTLIYKIMMYALSISRCELCQLLLIDDSVGKDQMDSKMVT